MAQAGISQSINSNTDREEDMFQMYDATHLALSFFMAFHRENP